MKAARIILVIALMPFVSAVFLNAGNTQRTKKTISAQEIVQEPTQTETSVETPESNEPTLLSEQNPVESGKVEQTEVTSTEEGIPAQPSEEDAKTEIQAMPFTDAANPSETFQFPLVKTLGGLGVVLCLMIALIFGAKKIFPQYFQKTVSPKSMKIIETLPMGDHRSISLIQVDGRRYLVGNTQNQINLLTPLTASESLGPENDNTRPKAIGDNRNETGNVFRNLFEVEKKRPVQRSGNPLPEDVRAKMRMLREALER